MATTSAQATSNVQTVAAAAEEMTATIAEIESFDEEVNIPVGPFDVWMIEPAEATWSAADQVEMLEAIEQKRLRDVAVAVTDGLYVVWAPGASYVFRVTGGVVRAGDAEDWILASRFIDAVIRPAETLDDTPTVARPVAEAICRVLEIHAELVGVYSLAEEVTP